MAERTIRNYEDAMAFLLEFTDYEKVTKYKYDIATFDLGRVADLMAATGDPHRAFRSVHIAGTKGKGSTGTMVQSVLAAAGFRTGLFTSPHLARLEERMTVDGEMMSEAELVEIVNELTAYTEKARRERPNESPTFFELVTAIGFRHFARRDVDFAVVEVGMGGRLDATNVLHPEVCAITRVDYDHVERLGGTLAKIAGEKAGIIKPGVPVVCAPQKPEAFETIERVAQQRGSPLIDVGREYQMTNLETGLAAVHDAGQPPPTGSAARTAMPFCRFDLTGPARTYNGLTLPLLGRHQAINAATAVAVAEALAKRRSLPLGEPEIRNGLASARLPARLECFPGTPPVLLDAAHNPASIEVLRDVLDGVFNGRRVVLVMSVAKDKDAAAMLKRILPRADAVVFTRSESPRAEEPELLAEQARGVGGVEIEIEDDALRALARVRELAGPQDLICITGSFYLAGCLRPALLA